MVSAAVVCQAMAMALCANANSHHSSPLLLPLSVYLSQHIALLIGSHSEWKWAFKTTAAANKGSCSCRRLQPHTEAQPPRNEACVGLWGWQGGEMESTDMPAGCREWEMCSSLLD